MYHPYKVTCLDFLFWNTFLADRVKYIRNYIGEDSKQEPSSQQSTAEPEAKKGKLMPAKPKMPPI